MLLRLLEPGLGCGRVYSVALVEEQTAPGRYRVSFRNASCVVKTRSILKQGEWVRFHGCLVQGVVACDFVEVIGQIDISLLIRCIERLQE